MGNEIRGNVLLARLAHVRKAAGESRLERILASLSRADQAVLRGEIWGAGLYSFDLNVRFDEAIARELSPHDFDKAFLDIGRASADENLKGADKIFVAPGDPQLFLSMAPQIYRFYYASGHREYEKTGARSASLRTYDAAGATASDCLTVLGWHIRGLEICGAKSIRATHPKCRAKGDPHCEYRFEWA